MKIIESSWDKPWDAEYSCTGCASKLEVQVSDLKLVSDCRDGDAAVFQCPVCKKDNWLAMSTLPKHVQSSLRS